MPAPLQLYFSQLNGMISRERAYYRNPAMTLAVTDAQQTQVEEFYGFANVYASTPVTADTLFEIGSIGKLFTAVALLQAQEAGLLSLDDAVTRHLPWFGLQNELGEICLQHLLSHSAGVVAGMDGHTDALAEVYALRETPAVSAPGKLHHYSNVGYKVLGLVLEAVYGRPYAEIIHSGILQPLEMAHSKAEITHADRDRTALGLAPLYDDRPYHRSLPLTPAAWVETNTGDGAILSTAADMARFARMLLNGGQGPHGRVLSAESFARLVRPAIAVDDGVSYAGGLYIVTTPQGEYWQHGGDMPGFEAALHLQPDLGLATVVLMATPHVPYLARFIFNQACALVRGAALQPLRSLPNPAHINDPARYAGVYTGAAGVLEIFSQDSRLRLRLAADESIGLEQRGEDCFFTPHPRFNRCLFHFTHGADGLTLRHGDQVYRAAQPAPAEPLAPAELRAACGHYRAHNPWQTNFRVWWHSQQLWLALPDGDELALTARGENTFTIEDDECSPEFLRFDWLLPEGFARVCYSGCWYDRYFTA